MGWTEGRARHATDTKRDTRRVEERGMGRGNVCYRINGGSKERGREGGRRGSERRENQQASGRRRHSMGRQ